MQRWLLLIIFVVCACSTLPVGEGLDRVRVGMDKDDVLNLAGNPKHSLRVRSQDHWIYDYFSGGDHEFHRLVVFENEHVVSISPARPAGAALDSGDDANDLEQYEQEVRQQQNANKGEFKDLPGQ